MLKPEMNKMFDKMSYEQQKEAMRLLDDYQAYDDSYNVVEVVVDAVVACVKVIAKHLF